MLIVGRYDGRSERKVDAVQVPDVCFGFGLDLVTYATALCGTDWDPAAWKEQSFVQDQEQGSRLADMWY